MSDSSGFSQSSAMERDMLPPERSTWPVWPWLVLAAALAGLLVWRTAFDSPEKPRDEAPPFEAGARLTSFRLEPLTGESRSITEADLIGKVTLVNFWGPWCSACMVEFPHLMEIEKHFRADADFQFLSVSTNYDPRDEKGLRESTERFLKQRRAEFPTYCDPGAATTIALIQTAKLDHFGYPTTVLLDREGAVQAVWMGFTPGDERQIRRAIQQAIKGQSPSAG